MAFLKILAAIAAIAWLIADCGAARAGGGPENVLLVVNSRSPQSMTIANHYVRLRRIPTPNILYLDWDGSLDAIDVDTLRQKILGPIVRAMVERGLTYQIDYIVYSADFPTRISFASDVPAEQRGKFSTDGSLTALTYYYAWTLAGTPNYLSLTSNHYLRQPGPTGEIGASRGFRGWYGWSDTGDLLEAGGNRYLLSTMLGVTSGRGNTVDEVLSYLKRSASADGTRPKGTIYFADHADVRSTTRRPGFAATAAALEKLGIPAQIIATTMPEGKRDVLGAMLGSANAPWPPTQCKIRPGAIVENLTSFGGVLAAGAGQTPLTEFLRYGAAGSSGTVTEPYAIQNKFPLPSIFVHYARGCSLAEAFYQSVWGPYQLLIVGDPLCRPWARIPNIQVSGVEQGATVRGTFELKPTAAAIDGHAVDRFELFVNGLRVAHCTAGNTLTANTATMADGYCELRVVGIEAGPIETQGELVLYLTIDNHGHHAQLHIAADKQTDGAIMTIGASSPEMAKILIFEQSRLLGTIEGDSGEIKVETKSLGLGPVVFRAVAKPADGASAVLSRPLTVEVEPADRKKEK